MFTETVISRRLQQDFSLQIHRNESGDQREWHCEEPRAAEDVRDRDHTSQPGPNRTVSEAPDGIRLEQQVLQLLSTA